LFPCPSHRCLNGHDAHLDSRQPIPGCGEPSDPFRCKPHRWPRTKRPARPRILLSSHDTFGLGNIRRSLPPGGLLTSDYPDAAILLVTGSPMIHTFRIPDHMDYVKLPRVRRLLEDRES
jgi:hypothetical protein